MARSVIAICDRRTVIIIDLLMGLLKGAIFPPWQGARKKPISLDGAFSSLNGPFSDLNGLFARVFEASKLVSTKTLLLKHYYRRQGKGGIK